MANMSSAFGTFYFDFSKTGKAPEQCIDWLKRFNETLLLMMMKLTLRTYQKT